MEQNCDAQYKSIQSVELDPQQEQTNSMKEKQHISEIEWKRSDGNNLNSTRSP